MSISLALFYVAATITVSAAIAVVVTRNIVYAAFGLLISLMGAAALFLMAFAEFLALVQVLIYGGAIVVVLLFTLMLTRIEDFEHLTDNVQWPFAIGVSLMLFGLLSTSAILTDVSSSDQKAVEFEVLGRILFIDWAVPFEVASLVLLVALVGAIIMVRSTGGRQ